jgi:hypothetical protein
MKKHEIKETIETLNLDINAKVAKFEKKFESDKWKRFYLKLSLLVVVGLGITIIICQTNKISELNNVCSPTGIDATKALSDMEQKGEKHIIQLIKDTPADGRGNLNKNQLLNAVQSTGKFDSIYKLSPYNQ